MNPRSTIEPLESRIAPAAVFTFTDVDGDSVTVKTSKGTNEDLAAAVHLADVGGGHMRLDYIDFAPNPSAFSKTNVSITATAAGGGDGFVNVGRINSLRPDGDVWISLGKVAVDGNLGEIDAGSSFDTKSASLTSLSVKSLGPDGFTLANTQGDGGSALYSSVKSVRIDGNLSGVFGTNNIGSLTITGDVLGGAITASLAGSVVITGKLQGGMTDGSGSIIFVNVKSFSIGSIVGGNGFASANVSINKASSVSVGSMVGGAGENSANLSIIQTVKRLTIDSITGGTGDGSASVGLFGFASQVTVTHDITGGKGETSGTLLAYQIDPATGYPLPVNIGTLTVGGTVSSYGVANQGVQAGMIFVSGSIAKLSIGNVEGDNFTMDPMSFGQLQTAQVEAYNGIGTLTVSGHLSAASSSAGGRIQADSAFEKSLDLGRATIGEFDPGGGLAARNIASLVVDHDIAGTAADPVGIHVGIALRSLLVKGNVSFATITAGLGPDGLAASFSFADAQIGTVHVQGNWTASSLVASVLDQNHDGFGNADDAAAQGEDTPFVVSTIKSITIGGTVTGTAAGGDHFGFTAQLIGSLKVNGTAVMLASGPFNDTAGAVLAPDTTAREISIF